MKSILFPAILVGSSLLFACGTTAPSKELVDARAAYQQAQTSAHSSLAQSDLYEAQKALARAERVSEDEGPDSDEAKNYAYVAHRKAILAEARGATYAAMNDKKKLDDGIAEYKKQKANQTEEQLAQAKKMLDSQGRELNSERQARAAAEQRTRDALEKMAGMAAKPDPRGLVVTLSGSVLFASNKSVLLPSASTRLADVAKALKEDGRPVTIVGHTDSQGDDAYNLKLSQARADAVKAYFVSQGIDASHITAQGAGESQPIADNESPEGRANNRRVELILPNATESTTPSSGR